MTERRLSRVIPSGRRPVQTLRLVPPPAPPVVERLAGNAVYVDGHRVGTPTSLPEAFQHLRSRPGAMVWLGLHRPDAEQLVALGRELGLDGRAVADLGAEHQRPKLETYGDTACVVLRPARYVEDREVVELGEVHVLCAPDVIVTIRHGEPPDLASVRRRLETDAPTLRRGTHAVLSAVVDEVVAGYAPVLAGLENDLDEIESQVFSGEQVSRRIYQLSREVVELQRAARPLHAVVVALEEREADEVVRRGFRDAATVVARVAERIDGFRQLLRDLLTVNATVVAQQQNEEMRHLAIASHQQNEEIKRISSWAAILFAPTLIGTVYGMNFRHMPELSWTYGYPFALLLMASTCAVLFLAFRRRGWLSSRRV